MTGNDVDGILRRYFVDGELSPQLRESVDQRLLSEDKIFWERFILVQDEVINDYVWGELRDREASVLEERFLRMPEVKRKVVFARALRQYVEEAAKEKPAPQPMQFWQRLSSSVSAPAWVAALLAGVLALLPIFTWQLGALRPVQGATYAVRLSASELRGAGVRERIPAGAQLVRLELEAPAGDHDAYSAEVYDVETDGRILTLHRIETGPGENSTVPVTLAADTLPPGDYYVTLYGVSSTGDRVELGRYGFRIPRE